MARVAILHQPPRPSDPAEYFGNDAAIAAYMTEALETDDPSFIGDGLGVVARAVRPKEPPITPRGSRSSPVDAD